MIEYALQLEAFADLDEIRQQIAEDKPGADDRAITEIFEMRLQLLCHGIR